MRVLVKLTGESLDIDDLKSVLQTSPWKITEEADGTFLSSPILDNLTDPKEIDSKAKQFLDAINGAVNIIHSNHKNVDTGIIKQKGDNGGYNITVLLESTIEARSRMTATLTTNFSPSTSNSQTSVENWIEKAERHQSVRDVLHFFNDDTWWNLFKIFEIIRDDLSGQKGFRKLLNRKEIKHFTQAAQSRELLGDLARHASKKYKRPVKDITFAEARGIIINLFNSWIIMKG